MLKMDEFYRPIRYDEIYYSDRGKECLDGEHAFAKQVTKTSDQIEALSHFILCKTNTFVDPWGDDFSRRRIREYSFKKVSQDAFEAYLKYLKTREQRYLIIARRNQHG